MACAIVLLFGASGRARAQTVIDFENLPAETLVTNQYLKSGVQVITSARIYLGPLRPHSGKHLLMSTQFQNPVQLGAAMALPPVGSMVIQFTRSQSSVRLYAGAVARAPNPPGGLFAIMTIKNRKDAVVASVGPVALKRGAVDTPLKWTSSDTNITSVTVTAFARDASGKQQAAAPGIDDLEFQAIRLATVPNLSGLTPETARNQLTKLGLTLGTVRQARLPEPTGTIGRQDPPPGSATDPGSSVAVEIALARVVVPDVGGRSLPDAKRKLRVSGLAVGKIDTVTLRGRSGTVRTQRPARGSLAYPGDSVDLTLAAASTATTSPIWFALVAVALVVLIVLAAPATRSSYLRLRIQMRLAGGDDRRIAPVRLLDIPLELAFRLREGREATVVDNEAIRITDERRSHA